MDYMLDPPDDPPEPSDSEVAEAERRIIEAMHQDGITIIEQIDTDVLLNLFKARRYGGSDAQEAAALVFDGEMERILFGGNAINEELEKMAEESRNDYDGPDPDDRIDEAAAWGGRDYPP